MKKRLVLLFTVICVLISGCTGGFIVADPIVPTDTKQPEFTATNTPVTPTESMTPTPVSTIEITPQRVPVDASMVKGLKPSILLSLSSSGNISGLPSDVSETLAGDIKAYYNAVLKKYSTAEVYLDVDTASNNFVIVIVMGGTIFYQTFKNQDGNDVYSNFPSSFENVGNGFELSGDYRPVIIPNSPVGVIWTDGIPQLLANFVELPNGETYFTHYMDYSGCWSYDAYPWKEILGVKEIMASFPPIEMDIEPIYTQTTEYEYMGVKIDAELILDKSASPRTTKVSIPDNVFAEFVARMFFSVWWNRQKQTQKSPTESDFVNFMKFWSEAQLSNDFQNWVKVKLDDIWANDLTDGLGYRQKPYDILPMCDAEITGDFTPINKVSIVLTGVGNEKNVTSYTGNTQTMDDGMGTNIAGRTLYLYYYTINSIREIGRAHV